MRVTENWLASSPDAPPEASTAARSPPTQGLRGLPPRPCIGRGAIHSKFGVVQTQRPWANAKFAVALSGDGSGPVTPSRARALGCQICRFGKRDPNVTYVGVRQPIWCPSSRASRHKVIQRTLAIPLGGRSGVRDCRSPRPRAKVRRARRNARRCGRQGRVVGRYRHTGQAACNVE